MQDLASNPGWHSRGYLPHFDSPGAIQLITFRLADSLPRSLIEQSIPQPDRETRLHDLLDEGRGACWLRHDEIAGIVEAAFLHHDGTRYRLLAWCIMPNHVHVVAEMIEPHSLTTIVRSWKAFTGAMANRALGRTGSFWYPDYFDRFIRNDRHLETAIAYVENNPAKARLVDDPRAWRWSSARRRGI